jgi:hypothetical protein
MITLCPQRISFVSAPERDVTLRLNKVMESINVTIDETDRPESKKEKKNQWNNFLKKKMKKKKKRKMEIKRI